MPKNGSDAMKLIINKKLRYAFIVIIPIIILASIYLLYREYKIPKYQEEKVELYKCYNRAQLNYNVMLKPNILYEQSSLGEGHLYITEFIDSIQTSYNYEFQGEKNADIRGDYEVVAQVEGYTGSGETYKTIWKKNFIIIGKQRFSAKDSKITLNKDASINLSDYDNFAKQVIEASKINANVKLTITMNVNVIAKTDAGTIEEKLSPNITIPLDTKYFEISGNPLIEKPGVIEVTRQIQLPPNKTKIMVYGIITGFFFLSLIFMIFFTESKAAVGPHERMLKKIFKKHGDRLVALDCDVVVKDRDYNIVKSIEDLVRIADELSKPIIYKYRPDYNEIDKFYVIDEQQVYEFNLLKALERERGELEKKTEGKAKKKSKEKAKTNEEKVITNNNIDVKEKA